MSYSTEPPVKSLARALLWPFAPAAALFILFAATALATARLLIRVFGLIGLVPGFILIALVVIGTSRYLFLVLTRTALGHNEAPLSSADHFNLFDDMRFSLVVAWLLLLAGGGLFASPAVTATLVVASLLLMPAIFALLAVTGDIASCIDPRRNVRFARRMGIHYFAMMAAMLIMVAGVLVTLAGWPPLLAEILGLYLLVVAFHLQGRLAYAQRAKLGFSAENSPELDEERRSAAADKAIQVVLDRIHPLSKVHEYRQALAALENAVEEFGAGEDIANTFTERVLAWESPELGLLYLQRRITAALTMGDTEAAWKLCQRGLAITNRFHAETGDEAVLLARYGCDTGAHRKAMQLVMEFEDRYPQLPDLLPTAALLEAKALAEKMGRPEVAHTRLRMLVRKYPECSDSEEITAYLDLLSSDRNR